MSVTQLQASLLARAFADELGEPSAGAMAFVRCFAPSTVEELASHPDFTLGTWDVHRVADTAEERTRSISADQAVEIRESKNHAALLLVDTRRAGAGMDGIYSAAREVKEDQLFDRAERIVAGTIRKRQSSGTWDYAKRALAKGRGYRGYHGVSRWKEFDFLCRVAVGKQPPGAHLALLGLWPVADGFDGRPDDALVTSRRFVDQFLGPFGTSQTVAQRIALAQVEGNTPALKTYLHAVDTRPLPDALAELNKRPGLWIGDGIWPKAPSRTIEAIELKPWRNKNGTIAKWSGMVEGLHGDVPVFFASKDWAKESRLEVRWSTRPVGFGKGAASYRVTVRAGSGRELAVKEVVHSARKSGEKCHFGADDFSDLRDGSEILARVFLEVVGSENVRQQESEEFRIRAAEPKAEDHGSVAAASGARRVRTFSEGLAELDSHESLLEVTHESMKQDGEGYVVLRTTVNGQRRKSYRVFRPSLIAEAEDDWLTRSGQIGRWTLDVNRVGTPVGPLKFVPFQSDYSEDWARAAEASRKFAEWLGPFGGIAAAYSDQSRWFSVISEYVLAWHNLVTTGDPLWALVNTIQVRARGSVGLEGLIVLPSHPLRVAWHSAYDNLVFHTSFDQGQTAKKIRKEFACLDGAMFPTFLPKSGGGTYVFADMLGFFAVGMVPDGDKEPKATLSMLTRAISNKGNEDSAPTVGLQSSRVLAKEIVKYIDCHESTWKLRLHALGAGDGETIARSLRRVHENYGQESEGGDDDGQGTADAPVYSLELYPSTGASEISGWALSRVTERRRAGGGNLDPRDLWMTRSRLLPGNVTVPRLRWARKDTSRPSSDAHLAVAFDMFDSQVSLDSGDHLRGGRDGEAISSSCYVFGLMGFYDRSFVAEPTAVCISSARQHVGGEKHPSRPFHTKRLGNIQAAVLEAVRRHLGADSGSSPVLRTGIPPEEVDALRDLHQRCDWVVTLDRNVGIEYFDSPRDKPDVYKTYVIDCVPERDDLGCLQMITSTADLDEVKHLLGRALEGMGLATTAENAIYVLEHLKGISGRLAIRLTGHRLTQAELIALAVARANCLHADQDDDCWVSLSDGFIVPVDDVMDLLPPLRENGDDSAHRPDLIYVTAGSRRHLSFRFIEVKHRQNLRVAKSQEIFDQIRSQTNIRTRWEHWYRQDATPSFRAIRRAKLARVLRFYADKAHRHGLPSPKHRAIVDQIERMVGEGDKYAFAPSKSDLGWVFCPEYDGRVPEKIVFGTRAGSSMPTRVFLFGPRMLPDFTKSSSAGGSVSPGGKPVLEDGGADSGSDPTVDSASDGNQEESNEPTAAMPTARGRCPILRPGIDVSTNADIEIRLETSGNPHLLVAGLPGMGKTTCLVNLCKQMIRSQVVPIVFSYHDDIDVRLAEAHGNVRFVDFDGLGFNPLQVFDRGNKFAHLDVAGAVRDIFAAIYPELGNVQTNHIRQAIKDSFEERGWGRGDLDSPEPPFARFVEILNASGARDAGTKTLLTRLSELEDYRFFEIGDTPRGSLWEDARPTIIRLHKTQNDVLQRAFAYLVFYGLYKDMFRRGSQDRITHALILDEAHRASRLKVIPTMAKQCRKYGISVMLASQEAKDFDESVFSAIANYLILRCTDADAKALAKNVSSSKHTQELIDTIKQMPKFHALYFGVGEATPSKVKLFPDEGKPGPSPG